MAVRSSLGVSFGDTLLLPSYFLRAKVVASEKQRGGCFQ